MKRSIIGFFVVLAIGLYIVTRLPFAGTSSASAAPATLHAHNQPVTPGAHNQAGHTITGKQSLNAAFIDQVLATAQSPMQGAGALFIRLGLQYHIDAAYVLAIFHHESNYGLTGEARASRSPGNLRCLDLAHYGDLGTWCKDAYAWFPTWSSGLVALYRLLAGPLYVAGGLTTIEQVIPRWAPSGDGNNPAQYIADVLADVASWRANV